MSNVIEQTALFPKFVEAEDIVQALEFLGLPQTGYKVELHDLGRYGLFIYKVEPVAMELKNAA